MGSVEYLSSDLRSLLSYGHLLRSVPEHQRNLPEGITLLRKDISRVQYLATPTLNRSR